MDNGDDVMYGGRGYYDIMAIGAPVSSPDLQERDIVYRGPGVDTVYYAKGIDLIFGRGRKNPRGVRHALSRTKEIIHGANERSRCR